MIPDATLKVYPDTGHAVAFERPEWVVRDLEEFIEGTRPAAWFSMEESSTSFAEFTFQALR